MTRLDDKLVPRALALIEKHGKVGSFRISSKVYNEATGKVVETVTNVSRKVSPPYEFDKRLVNGDTIKATDLKVIVAASGLSFTPSIGNQLTLDGTSYHVLNVSPHYTGELIAAYTLHLRK